MKRGLKSNIYVSKAVQELYKNTTDLNFQKQLVNKIISDAYRYRLKNCSTNKERINEPVLCFLDTQKNLVSLLPPLEFLDISFAATRYRTNKGGAILLPTLIGDEVRIEIEQKVDSLKKDHFILKKIIADLQGFKQKLNKDVSHAKIFLKDTIELFNLLQQDNINLDAVMEQLRLSSIMEFRKLTKFYAFTDATYYQTIGAGRPLRALFTAICDAMYPPLPMPTALKNNSSNTRKFNLFNWKSVSEAELGQDDLMCDNDNGTPKNMLL